ncbi:Hypothetical predicted protein [Octopus vulgaris]|uniref:Secreted protein n=1 Tax=Octopus vulgaris TaxID=6645 RepID=A0AA36AN89_OCTVU|nr:Hypothetical predicted protein [Octopus vulgaris]
MSTCLFFLSLGRAVLYSPLRVCNLGDDQSDMSSVLVVNNLIISEVDIVDIVVIVADIVIYCRGGGNECGDATTVVFEFTMQGVKEICNKWIFS